MVMAERDRAKNDNESVVKDFICAFNVCEKYSTDILDNNYLQVIF